MLNGTFAVLNLLMYYTSEANDLRQETLFFTFYSSLFSDPLKGTVIE